MTKMIDMNVEEITFNVECATNLLFIKITIRNVLILIVHQMPKKDFKKMKVEECLKEEDYKVYQMHSQFKIFS